jgi:hypothetical protein
MRSLFGVISACALLAMLAGASVADAFGVERYTLTATEEGGSADSQAGSHPYELTTEVAFDRTGGQARELDFEFPPGLSIKPAAVTECTRTQFAEAACPDDAAVGIVVMDLAGTATAVAVYDIISPPQEPAQLGFTIDGSATLLVPFTRTGGDYGLTMSMHDIPQKNIEAIRLVLWGVPGEPSHDAQRGSCLTDRATDCEGTEPGIPFLALPNECAAAFQSTARAYSWEDPTASASDTAVFGQLSGCGSQSFDPTISVEPDTTYAGEPAGYTVELRVPPSNDSSSPTAQLQDAQIALPEGTSLNPGAPQALASCSEAQSALTSVAEKANGEEDTGPAQCPAAAKVGTVKIDSALVETAAPQEFKGDIYLLQSNPPDVKMLLAASAHGVNLKLVANAHLNQLTGQITLVFAGLPQLAISGIELTFSGGPFALLANPQTCGVFTATGDLTPWSGGTDVARTSSFPITAMADGGACESPPPFEPSLSAGTLVDTAGSYSPLSLTVSTHVFEQNLSRLSFALPRGLEWMFASVPPCGEPQATSGTCASASEVGTATVEAGAGPYPASLIGAVYLTGGYAGGQYGLSVAIDASTGPFALGEMILRAAIDVNPTTGALSIAGDPLPSNLDGVPLRIQTVNLTIAHPEFIRNPTICEPRQIAATIEGLQGTTVQTSNPFGTADCQSLAAGTISGTQGGGTITGAHGGEATKPARLSLASASIAVRNGVAAIKLTCTGLRTCSGKLTLAATNTSMDSRYRRIAAHDRHGRAKAMSIGTATFSIPRGKTAIVALELNAVGRALLDAHHGRLGANLTIVGPIGGSASTRHVRVRLTRTAAPQRPSRSAAVGNPR